MHAFSSPGERNQKQGIGPPDSSHKPRDDLLVFKEGCDVQQPGTQISPSQVYHKGPEIALRSCAHREGRAVEKAADSGGVTVPLCWETRLSALVPSDGGGAEDTDIAAWL